MSQRSNASPPEPPRPLGAQGKRVWVKYAALPGEDVLFAAELADEHYILRSRVLKDGDPQDRRALREVEVALRDALRQLDTSLSWSRYGKEVTA
jgi:hypothetical protein